MLICLKRKKKYSFQNEKLPRILSQIGSTTIEPEEKMWIIVEEEYPQNYIHPRHGLNFLYWHSGILDNQVLSFI